MKYNFDEIINRRKTNSIKWEVPVINYGREDILPMWVADMDFKSPDVVVNKIKERAEHGVYGYTLKEDTHYKSIIDWVKRRHGWEIEKDWISFSPGIVTAISLSVLAYTQPGDKVIIQTPVYHPFFSCVQNNGRIVVENKLKNIDGRYEMDFDDLENKIDPRVKMLILCSPHNPIGRVWSAQELKRLGEICIKNDILIISDEIHSDIIFKGNKHTPVAKISKELENNTVTCIAPSKTFNVAGLMTSAIIIPNRKLRAQFVNVLDNIGLGGLNVFGAVALENCYNYGEEWLEELLVYLEDNSRFVMDYIYSNIPNVNAVKPEGTYLMWLDFRKLGINQKELNEIMIKRAGVLLNDGLEFGSCGEGFLRMNIGTPRPLLEQGLKKIDSAVKSIIASR